MKRYGFIFTVVFAVLCVFGFARAEVVVMEGDKIFVCEHLLEYPKPAKELGIPNEVALAVLSEWKSQKFETELSRKVIFFAFPPILEIEEEATKIASYNLTQGWRVENLRAPKIARQKLWGVLLSMTLTFLSMLGLVYCGRTPSRFLPPESVADVVILSVIIVASVVITGFLLVSTGVAVSFKYLLLIVIMVNIAIVYGEVLSKYQQRKNKQKKSGVSLSV